MYIVHCIYSDPSANWICGPGALPSTQTLRPWTRQLQPQSSIQLKLDIVVATENKLLLPQKRNEPVRNVTVTVTKLQVWERGWSVDQNDSRFEVSSKFVNPAWRKESLWYQLQMEGGNHSLAPLCQLRVRMLGYALVTPSMVVAKSLWHLTLPVLKRFARCMLKGSQGLPQIIKWVFSSHSRPVGGQDISFSKQIRHGCPSSCASKDSYTCSNLPGWLVRKKPL